MSLAEKLNIPLREGRPRSIFEKFVEDNPECTYNSHWDCVQFYSADKKFEFELNGFTDFNGVEQFELRCYDQVKKQDAFDTDRHTTIDAVLTETLEKLTEYRKLP